MFYDISDKTLEDSLIGSVLYKEQEKFDDFIKLDIFLDLYTTKQIKKYFGLNLFEFLHTTRYTKLKLIEKANKMLEEESKVIDKLDSNTSEVDTNISLEDMGLGGFDE